MISCSNTSKDLRIKVIILQIDDNEMFKLSSRVKANWIKKKKSWWTSCKKFCQIIISHSPFIFILFWLNDIQWCQKFGIAEAPCLIDSWVMASSRNTASYATGLKKKCVFARVKHPWLKGFLKTCNSTYFYQRAKLFKYIIGVEVKRWCFYKK